MAGPTPGRPTPPGLGDLLNLFGSNNPLAALAKSVDQFRMGVTGFIEVVTTFRQTLETLNAIGMRVNDLLDEIEGPVRAVMPQVTKSAEQASRMFATLSGPVERVAPGLAQLADVLGNPALQDMPRRLSDVMDIMSSLPRTLGPLAQMADMAGGLFGGGLGLAGLGPSAAATRAAREAYAERAAALAASAADAQTPVRKAPPRKAAPRQATAKRSPAKRTAKSAQATFERSAAKKSSTKKAPAKRSVAKKTASKKTASKRTTAKKAPTKKAAARRAAGSPSGARS